MTTPPESSPRGRLHERARDILRAEGHSLAPRPSGAGPSSATEVRAPAADPDPSAVSAAEPAAVEPTTRLVLARLASGKTALAETGTAPGGAGKRPSHPSRFELAALGFALISAAVIGAALPSAQPLPAQAAVPTQLAAAPALAAVAPAPTAASQSGSASADAASSDAALGATDLAALGPVTPAAAAAAPSASDTNSAGSGPGDAGDGSDPLAGSSDHLTQVALIVVHGDAPVLWPASASASAAAASGQPASAARAANTATTRAALGTTFTSVASLPASPLATGIALMPASRATRQRARSAARPRRSRLARRTTWDASPASVATNPAAAASLPGAIARDGRTWAAYAPVDDAAQAAKALCGTGDAPGAPATTDLLASSPLAHLADLIDSGSCAAAAKPLTALADDLKSDAPPAWLTIDVGACDPAGCTPAQAEARDEDLDAAITTLSAKDGLDESSAILVVGDGTAPNLQPAEAGAMPAAPDDPGAPAPVLSGALLIGKNVEADKTDPLALDPFAIARTQATWLGVDPPGWAAVEGTTELTVPGS